MNQQQDSQESSSQLEDDKEQSIVSSPRLIHGKGGTHEGPKSEHPSTYDESIPPLTYHAQDYGEASSSSSQNVGASPRTARTGASPVPTDRTNAPKMAQRPYSQYTGSRPVPSWARPQKNGFETIGRSIWLYVLIAILALPVLWLIVTIIIPAVVLVVLILLAVFGILLLAFVIIAVLWFVGRIDSMKPPFWW